ncbi:Polyphosphate kinase, partial [Candidatus Omnitrophus magneticus]
TDIGYFTRIDDFAMDISDLFNVITGLSQPARRNKIVASPNYMRKSFSDLKDKENKISPKTIQI